MAKVNDTQKAEMLGSMLAPGESYSVTAYASTVPTVNVFSMFGAIGVLIGELLDDTGFKTVHSAYVGVTDNYLNVVVLNGFSKGKIKSSMRFNFTEVTDLKVTEKKSCTLINVKTGNKSYNLQVPKKVIGAKLATQSEDFAMLATKLNEVLARFKVA